MKTHVAIGVTLCPICLSEQKGVLLDTRMEEVFECGKEIFTGFKLCSECYNKVLAGQVALIEAEGPLDGDIKIADVTRTGRGVWVDGKSLKEYALEGFAFVTTEIFEDIISHASEE